MKPSTLRHINTEKEVSHFLWRTIPNAMRELAESKGILPRRIHLSNGKQIIFPIKVTTNYYEKCSTLAK